MQDLNSFNYTTVKDFIQAAFSKSVELGAFIDDGFSVDKFMNRVMENGFETTFNYIKAQSKKFERISYSTSYRRKSSSGKIAKTSIIFYRFDINFVANIDGTKTAQDGIFLRLCWPVHLMNKKDLWFNLKTGEIWLAYSSPESFVEYHKKVTMDELLNLCYVEMMGSIHFIVKQKTVLRMTKKEFSSLPSETIRDHLTLCDMIEV